MKQIKIINKTFTEEELREAVTELAKRIDIVTEDMDNGKFIARHYTRGLEDIYHKITQIPIELDEI